MWWMKCIGSLLILVGCGFLGWEKGAMLRRRIWLLREMIQSLVLFKSLTGTYRLPLTAGATGRRAFMAADGGRDGRCI